MIDMTTPEEQERALTNYYKWFTYLRELETKHDAAGTSLYKDPEWRFTTSAEQAWASAVRRSGLPFPPEHLKLRYVA